MGQENNDITFSDGVSPHADGEIYYDSAKVSGLPTHLISRKGIGYVPENQGIFHDLTVEETFALARGKGEEVEGK